jgi:hypothetical protein
VSNIRSPMLLPLFKMLLWVKQAALGIDVVPLVNCIFTISSQLTSFSPGTPALLIPPSSKTFSYGIVAFMGPVSTLPAELLTRMTDLREGTTSDSKVPILWMSGIRAERRSILERGGLRGRFVSVLMIKWDAVRCVSADNTCDEVKAGFRGTWNDIRTARRLEYRYLPGWRPF